MAENEVDPIDLGAVIIGPIAAAMEYDVFQLDVQAFNLGTVLNDPFFTASGMEVTPAAVIAVASVVWIVATNEALGDGSYENKEKAVLGAAIAAVPAHVVIPAVQDLVAAHDLIALTATIGFGAAVTVVAYVK